MDKPTIIKIKELKEGIAGLVNGSALPPCVVQMVMQDINIQINNLVREELNDALRNAEKELNNE